MTSPTTARLALEDGLVLTGRSFGASAPSSSTGEVVFNTAMSGYQEALTDPSYSGQILVMTSSQIGNYGVCQEDNESARVQVAGFVVREAARRHSNQRAEQDLGGWLADAGVIAMDGVDTRALVRRLRESGAMRGVISTDASLTDGELVDRAAAGVPMSGRNLAAEVTPGLTSSWTRPDQCPGETFTVVALDCGAKRNIYRNLSARGCHLEIMPFDASAEAIREKRPDGLFISNGPGDPAAVETLVGVLREIAGEVPTFGICLGHQLLALALGAKTYKLKFGHRGSNHPVKCVVTGLVEITSQNHGFCVEAESLEGCGGQVTHLHLNDGTVAGFRHRELPIFAVQYHPEASPGPHDASYLFDGFIEMMRTGRPLETDFLAAARRGETGASLGSA